MSESTSDDDDGALPGVPREVLADVSFNKKYELERQLGVGGAGIVVCARHRELDERVAIKFLLTGSENHEAVARFRREARAANRVKDKHVVRIVDHATTETGVPYVVMEYLDGLDLEQMLQQTPGRQLPVADAVEFVLQASEALAECHALGIVHRDLKPSNLFCTHGADGLPFVKVLDFGISKLTQATTDDARTGKHAIIGSPRYMSPEQFDTPAEVDHRTDIWALGVILYELVTGAAPFTGTTVLSIWDKVKNQTPRSMLELRRDAPVALGKVIARCMQKQPADRFQNLAELAKELLAFAPERSRESVQRIVRIVQAPGVSTASLSLPPSRRTPVEATSRSVLPRPPSTGMTRLFLIGLAGGTLLVVAVRMIRAWSPAAPPGAGSAENAQPTSGSALVPDAKLPIDHLAVAASASAQPAQTLPSAADSTTPSLRRAPAASDRHRRAVPVLAPKSSSEPVASGRPLESAKPSPWVVEIIEERKTPPRGQP